MFKKTYYFIILSIINNFKVFCEENIFFTKLETIQVVNKEKNYNGPLRVILIFIKNPLFLETAQEWNKEDWLRLLRDFDFFRTNIMHHLSMAPVIINMVDKSVSGKLLIHHNKKSIVAIGIIAISPDGSYISKLIIPDNIYKNIQIKKNIIFIIENNTIKINTGIIV